MADGIDAEMAGIVAELKLCSKKYASSVRKQLRAAVNEAGAETLAKIRSEASWSSRIPAATTIRLNFSAKSAGIRIVTNRRRAPHARPYEFGNASADELVNGTGGRMSTRPFFFDSVEKMDAPTQKKIVDAMDQACREAGFR